MNASAMQLATWWQALPVIVAVLAALYLPGGAVAVASGRRGVDLVALAPVVSIVIVGMSGIVAYAIGLPWGWPCYLIATAAVCVVVVGVRIVGTRFGRSPLRAAGASGDAPLEPVRRPVWWRRVTPAFAGVALAAVSTTVRLIHAVPSPDQITQNYDSVFHDNIVARIIVTGQASSLHALPPIRDVYPIAFQQFAALGALAVRGTTAAAAITGAWLVFAALLWPTAVLFLVRCICGAHAITDFLAPVLAVVCAAGPFLLLDWGTLYSMFAGNVVLPVSLGLVWTWCASGWKRGVRDAGLGLVWIAVAVLAVSLCHFRVMMTGLLLALPVLVVWVFDVLRAVRRSSKALFHALIVGGALVIAAVLALGVRVFVLMYLRGVDRPIAAHLNGGPAQPTEHIPSAIMRFLLGRPIDSSNTPLAVFWPVAVLIVGALIVALVVHSRESLMLVASFVLLGVIFVSSAGTHADWAKVLTALWYKDQRRPFAAWPIVAAALICWAVGHLVTTYGARCVARRPWTRSIVAVLVVAFALMACAINPQLDGMGRAVGRTYGFAAGDADSPMLSRDEYLMLKRMSALVPEGERVVSDPWNGSGFLLAVGWRTPFYPHLSMMWDHDHDYLARNLHAIDTDPEVCAIIQRNDLRWYLDMGGSFAPHDPQHVMFDGMRPVPGAMEPVARQGRAVLYRIVACGMPR